MFLTIVEDPHFCELGGYTAFRASLPRPAAPPRRCRDALQSSRYSCLCTCTKHRLRAPSRTPMRWYLPFVERLSAPLLSPAEPMLDASAAEALANGTAHGSDTWQRAWQSSQEAVLSRSAIQPSLRMLYISPVGNTPHVVARYTRVFGPMRDKVLWLCHYDHVASVWEQQPWYVNPSGPVVKRDLMGEPGELACKPHCWRRVLLPSDHGYDFIMMMDEVPSLWPEHST